MVEFIIFDPRSRGFIVENSVPPKFIPPETILIIGGVTVSEYRASGPLSGQPTLHADSLRRDARREAETYAADYVLLGRPTYCKMRDYHNCQEGLLQAVALMYVKK